MGDLSDLSELPIIGQFVAAWAAALDLLLNSGEIVLSLLAWVITHVGSLLPVLSVLNRLGERLPALPTVPGWVITLALAALLTTSLLRLIKKLK
jgi:hypothetical protein